jgi:hypothetical protein
MTSLFKYKDKQVKDVLQQNANIPFVDRILNPQNYADPEIFRGKKETHLMASSDNYAYPTVIYENNKYRKFTNFKDAFKHNLKTGNVIKFKTKEEANTFAKNYKSIPSARKFNEYYQGKKI